MTYPKHLYRSPGPYRADGFSYDVAGAANEAEEASLVARGWHTTKQAAFGRDEAEAIIEQAEELSEALDEITPPTRAELEQKAEELKVPFNARTKDEVLAKRIAEAL
jgi:hypothetical protein